MTKTRLSDSLGVPRTTSRPQFGSGSSQFRVGGIRPRLTPRRLAISSTPPQPETRLPIWPLRLVTGGIFPSPKRRRNARDSARSPTTEPAPWALTWPIAAGSSSASRSAALDGHLGPGAVGVLAAAGVGVAAGAEAEDLAVDPGPLGARRARALRGSRSPRLRRGPSRRGSSRTAGRSRRGRRPSARSGGGCPCGSGSAGGSSNPRRR